MTSIKKAKLEYFNLLRELYLNVENRDVVNEVLVYICRDVRCEIVSSLGEGCDSCELCNNCFKKFKGEPLHNGDHGFCVGCTLSHFDKYTKFIRRTISPFGSSVCFEFYHNCDISDNEYYSKTVTDSNFVDFVYRFTGNTKLITNPSSIFWPKYSLQ